jgi:DHA2 family multidrug resistance protein-like MFS transporter
VFTLAADLMVGTAPAERAGARSGISETSSEFGGALGSIGTAVYRGGIAEAVPAGVPPELAEAARDSLGGALEVAGRLPAEAGAALFAAASEAFTRGLQLVAEASTGLADVIAVLAAAMLRQLPPDPTYDGGPTKSVCSTSPQRPRRSIQDEPPRQGRAVETSRRFSSAARLLRRDTMPPCSSCR